MNRKGVVKIAVDVLMTLALFFLMGYSLWGEKAHEWVGTGLFCLFIIHHVANGYWHKTIGKGKYHTLRLVTLCVDCLLFVAMLAQMYSAVVMSRYVFAFLPFHGNLSAARRLHLLGAYWGFLFMGLHLGLHWNLVLNLCRKVTGSKKQSKSRGIFAFLIGAGVAGYGVWALIRRELPVYLFLQSAFVFFDDSEPKLLFYLDYLALMGLCVFLAHYSAEMIRKWKGKAAKQQ